MLTARQHPIQDVLGVYVYWGKIWTFKPLAKTLTIGGCTYKFDDHEEDARAGFVCVTKSATDRLLLTTIRIQGSPLANRGIFNAASLAAGAPTEPFKL